LKITVTATEPKDNKLEANITVAAADVDAAIKKAYKDIANQYRFQGFRKGKAPRPVIDGLVGKNYVLAQASEDVLQQAQPLMLDELDIVPVGEPHFDGEAKLVTEGADFEATLVIDVRPDCELESYDAPEINMPPAEVTEAELAEQLDALLSYRASFEDAADDYVAAENDLLTIDVENVENGESLAGEDRPFMLGSTQVPAEFNDAIKGMKVGETKDVEIHVNGTDEAEAKTIKVKVTLKSAKKRVLPELNDEFAKSAGFDTVDAFKDAVKDEIAKDKETSLPNLKESRVIEKLAEALKLDEVPEDYVKQVHDEIAQDILAQLQRQGLTLDAWLNARGIQAHEFLNDLNEQALERARQSLALDALAKKLGFEASDEDIRAEFEDAGVADVDASLKEFKEAGRMPAVRESIKRTKAVDWLVENAKVNIVDEVAERRAARDAE
jgi:trigger factor